MATVRHRLDSGSYCPEAPRVYESGEKELADWAPMVLASATPRLRTCLQPALKFDARLARIVLSAKEPALAQIRLAWWRDEVSRQRADADALPSDPLLASLLETWTGHDAYLIRLVDGWEELIGDPPWGQAPLEAFMKGRAGLFEAIAELSGNPQWASLAGHHGSVWALADLAYLGATELSRTTDLPRLPLELRPLAIVGGLSRRALKRGGKPLFGDRLSPIVALRLGIFGT